MNLGQVATACGAGINNGGESKALFRSLLQKGGKVAVSVTPDSHQSQRYFRATAGHIHQITYEKVRVSGNGDLSHSLAV
jgi:hypothetical protein